MGDWRIGGLVDWWIGGLVDWWIGGLGNCARHALCSWMAQGQAQASGLAPYKNAFSAQGDGRNGGEREGARPARHGRRRRDGDGERREERPSSAPRSGGWMTRRAIRASRPGRERSAARRRCRASCQPWPAPAPKRNGPMRKWMTRQATAPEGNLLIVERCGRKARRHFRAGVPLGRCRPQIRGRQGG